MLSLIVAGAISTVSAYTSFVEGALLVVTTYEIAKSAKSVNSRRYAGKKK